MQNRVYSLLGIATKAGKTRSGAFQTQEAIEYGHARLVILSRDARNNTVHDIQPKCEARSIPLRFYGTKEELGHAMGKELRSCLAITDEGLATAVMKAIDAFTEQAAAGETPHL